MRILLSDRFRREYGKLPQSIRRRVDEQIIRLADHPQHPSLNLKKMEGVRDIWRVKVTKGYRITLQIDENTALLRRVGTHDVLKNP